MGATLQSTHQWRKFKNSSFSGFKTKQAPKIIIHLIINLSLFHLSLLSLLHSLSPSISNAQAFKAILFQKHSKSETNRRRSKMQIKKPNDEKEFNIETNMK